MLLGVFTYPKGIFGGFYQKATNNNPSSKGPLFGHKEQAGFIIQATAVASVTEQFKGISGVFILYLCVILITRHGFRTKHITRR